MEGIDRARAEAAADEPHQAPLAVEDRRARVTGAEGPRGGRLETPRGLDLGLLPPTAHGVLIFWSEAAEAEEDAIEAAVHFDLEEDEGLRGRGGGVDNEQENIFSQIRPNFV